MKAILVDNDSKQIINCSVHHIEEDDFSKRLVMDSKNCNICKYSEFDADGSDYKVAAIDMFKKSGNVRVWVRFPKGKSWSMALQAVDANIVELQN